MKLIYASFILVFTFVMVSCKKDVQNSRLEIALNGCNTTGINGKLEICYTELIEDSRCPANANCFDQGVAKARFTIKVGEHQKTFELSTLDRLPHHKNKTRELGYDIRLIQINPYPGLNGTIHSAEIEISE